MRTIADVCVSERLSTAAGSKEALLEKFKAQSTASDPAFAAREETRRAVRIGREAREAERNAARDARKAAEQEALQAEQAERAAREALEAQETAEQAARQVAMAAEAKAARDAR
ncbi:DUF6481 family protein [Azospirillum sp. TSA2s]|uniref:DUF6481 family protein n=1 Tax=Azospirillum sp. TSA2s TaxID=709810 RepID=UPI001B3C00DE|nr:DUF6481 family protein [Azospirillum sp. TSA2s]